MNSRGYILFSSLLTFRRLSHWAGVSLITLKQAAKKSQQLKVKGDGVRKKDGWMQWTFPPRFEKGEEIDSGEDEEEEEKTEVDDGSKAFIAAATAAAAVATAAAATTGIALTGPDIGQGKGTDPSSTVAAAVTNPKTTRKTPDAVARTSISTSAPAMSYASIASAKKKMIHENH